MNQPAFIDFEASSLDLLSSYPIEVGVCMPDGTLHSWLIKPHVLWLDWSDSAQAIHGISRQQLEKEGKNISTVAQALNSLLGTDFVYCDAWTFDCFWLHRLYKSAQMKPTFHLESVSAMLSEHQIERWLPTRQEVVKDLNLTTHRAANDARILYETWNRLSHE